MGRVQKLAKSLVHTRAYRSLIHGVLPTMEHSAAFTEHEFDTVIDVGANKGQFAAFAQIRWPKCNLVCFEPLESPRGKLEKILRKNDRFYPFALGKNETQSDIHLASRRDSSSLLPLGERQKNVFHMTEEGTVPVSIRRLDGVLDRSLGRPCLLKIDVQGFELDVLNGADKILDLIDVIYVEVSHQELYIGQPLADEITKFLNNHNYEFISHHNPIFDNGGLLQADALFQRRYQSPK